MIATYFYIIIMLQVVNFWYTMQNRKKIIKLRKDFDDFKEHKREKHEEKSFNPEVYTKPKLDFNDFEPQFKTRNEVFTGEKKYNPDDIPGLFDDVLGIKS